MTRARSRSPALLVAVMVVAGACSSAEGEGGMGRLGSVGAGPSVTVDEATSTSVDAPAASPMPVPAVTVAAAPATTAPPSVVLPPPPPVVSPPAPPRAVLDQPWTPFATVGGLTLVHPSSRVERVGFHQSNHEGARQLEPMASAAAPATLEPRHRLTGARTSADVVIDPDVEVRSPVTGTVKRAGTYVLYCEYSDDYAVIQPDGQPGWEVKILHIDGVRVGAGERVTAGETVIAGGPTPLPFESQVDELTTAESAWPHVHIEVIDPAIPNVPSPGGGCD